MTDSALSVEGVSKIYRIGLQEQTYDSIGREFVEFVKSPIRNYRKYRSLYRFSDDVLSGNYTGDDILWALRDVSFQVKQGEVVGIIGVNGAGKSTLLKVISRITPPTKGQITIRGRVSSLLEVGTGFHPELTGRENVYLNGTILGMRKHEVERKFDEIVDFSGVEKFLDTPVKRYSIGIRVRLGLAVPAHLEPEILIIDEVLAVGDAEFQKKCLNKMEDVGNEGRTVLFVSHNMAAITRLCPRVNLIIVGTDLEFITSPTRYDMEVFKKRRNISSNRLASEGYQLPCVILFMRCKGAQEKMIEPLPRQVAVSLGAEKLFSRFLSLRGSFTG